MQLSVLLSDPSYPKKSLLEKLVMHRLDITKEALFTKTALEISQEDQLWIHDSYLQITQDHRPLEYVLGYCEFSGHRFAVTEATLIPRPETEYMIEAVREWVVETTESRMQNTKTKKKKKGEGVGNNSNLKDSSSSLHSDSEGPDNKKITLLDIGTGCGVLGLSTLLHCSTHIGEAILTDLSADALAVARKNFLSFLKSGQLSASNMAVQFLKCSLLDHEMIREFFETRTAKIRMMYTEESTQKKNKKEKIKGKHHGDSPLLQRGARGDLLIVANLPYIPDGLFEDNTDPSVHKREPKMAFVGGNDGMDLYRIMLGQIVEYGATNQQLLATSYSPLASEGITLFLEMMTWQVDILRKEFGEWFEFEEVKTFHFNIRIVKGMLR